MGGGRNNSVLRNYFENCSLGINIGERNAAAYDNPINGSFQFGGPSEGVQGGIVSALHIDDPTSPWGKAYGPGSARPFNWTYLWDGPAFDHVADNRFCGCHQNTDEVQMADDYAGSGPHPSWCEQEGGGCVNTTAWNTSQVQALLKQTITNNSVVADVTVCGMRASD